MHHPKFQQLEGTWRGLTYLVMNSETSAQLKLKVDPPEAMTEAFKALGALKQQCGAP